MARMELLSELYVCAYYVRSSYIWQSSSRLGKIYCVAQAERLAQHNLGHI